MTTPPGQPATPDPERPQPDAAGWPPPHTQGYGAADPNQQPGYQYGAADPNQQPGYEYGQPAYGQPAYVVPGYGDPMAPYGYDPMGRPYSDKQKLVAGLLGILVGGFGVGRFYTGHTSIGIAQLAVTLVTCGFGALWGLIDGIIILVNGGTDADGRPLRD